MNPNANYNWYDNSVSGAILEFAESQRMERKISMPRFISNDGVKLYNLETVQIVDLCRIHGQVVLWL
jgi:hypothetical protein